MKSAKKELLTLKTETIRVLDREQLVAVQGGAEAASWGNSVYICVSNNGGGRSCSVCPGAAGA
jgi:hypothetical protein